MAADQPAINDHLDEGDHEFLSAQIYAYNVETTGIADGRTIAGIVRDEQGAIVAAVSGWTWGGCLEVEYLWVRADRRGHGYGAQLLAAAEQEAIARGCRQATLSTHSFQAPEFYRKYGYEVCGVVDDYPQGHQKIYLRKSLR